MINGKSVLAIIPARGGSKRLPKKNIRLLKNKPLIAWTIQAALNSKYIDKVIVSSDSEEILKKSIKFGADIILRPTDLATDRSSSFSVIEHILNKINKSFDYIILLQPTSPLRNNEHIDSALDSMVNKSADAIISVCEEVHSPLLSNTLPRNNSMVNFLRDIKHEARSQDLPKFYRLNGAIYIYNIKKLLKQKTLFFKENIFAFKMKRKHSVDIDDEFDFMLTEIILNKNL